MALLEISHLSVDYISAGRAVHAVDDVSLTLAAGGSLGLVGESGSGKSTLGMAVLRLLNDNARVRGAARLEGEDLLTMGDARLREVRWRKIAAVFQKSMNSLSPVHRIGMQMADIYRVHHPEEKKAAMEQVGEALQWVRLPKRVLKLYPHELSGGMMQRVSIALSLLNHPSLVIFDEATTALDVITQGQILKEIARLQQEFRLARIMITHDMAVVAGSCETVAVLYAGRLMEAGPTRAVLSSPMHPYTKGLTGAFPSLYGEGKTLSSIPGRLPDLSTDIPGCVFAPRCPYALARCRRERPPLLGLGGGRQAACFLVKEAENHG